MDNSEAYILMCKQAEEVTGEHEWKGGDIFVWLEDIRQDTVVHNWWIDRGAVDFYREGNWESSEFITATNAIWLPRQDQLQEILPSESNPDNQVTAIQNNFLFGAPGYTWTDDFGYGEDDDRDIDYYRRFTSMEQLWLAFVMKEKYGKVWNGEDWWYKSGDTLKPEHIKAAKETLC